MSDPERGQMDASEEDELPAYMTPLYMAVSDRDFAKAKALIDSGYPIDDEPTDDGYTLLHRAVQGGEIDTVRFLLSVGCRRALNTFDYVEHTPLIWAAEEGRLEIARLLLVAGANVNAHNEERIGNTAIREAARAGDLRMVELLLSAGADPTIPGWMQIDAVLQAKIKLEEEPGSKVRSEILALLQRGTPKKDA
jgi:ankyrin repeat protein